MVVSPYGAAQHGLTSSMKYWGLIYQKKGGDQSYQLSAEEGKGLESPWLWSAGKLCLMQLQGLQLT